MNKKISLSVVIFVVVVAVICSATVSICVFDIINSTNGNNTTTVNTDRFSKLYQLADAYEKLYYYDIDEDALIESILDGYIAGTGDLYGEYYSAADLSAFNDDINGEFTGIGVSVIYNSTNKAIEIINVMPDSPALEEDLRAGDMIYAIGTLDSCVTVDSLGYENAVSKIRGETGTIVDLVVLRDGQYMEFHVARRRVIEQSVTYHTYANDSSVGIIKISGFNTNTPSQFVEAANALLNTFECKYLVFDVRNNPGGELNSVCSILDCILPEGPVVRSVDNKGNEQVLYRSDKKCIDVPMAVICNNATASAGELFTAALQDYGVATIVGVKTYGKGCMQTTRMFSDGSGFKVTYRLYNPPFSDNYDGVGITPDEIVDISEELKEVNIYKYTDYTDNQLAAAVDAVKNR